MDHFKRLPLGPNVASFVPHSMLRVEAMGLEAAISPQADGGGARSAWSTLLEEAMQQGYLGLSTDGLPFHYLANEPHTDKRIPTQFASFGETASAAEDRAQPRPRLADHADPRETA
jgi:N-acyl-D-aspartate/D-glutamate deacylase